MGVNYKKIILILFSSMVVSLTIVGINGGFPARLMANTYQGRVFAPRLADLAEAIQLMNNTNCIVVDVRESKYYAFSHIPHAINLPTSLIRNAPQSTLQLLREAKTTVIYCDAASCGSSIMAARLLADAGITNSAVYSQGFLEWVACCFPVEKTEK
jgi:rhodanese-related sulfurtransferase